MEVGPCHKHTSLRLLKMLPGLTLLTLLPPLTLLTHTAYTVAKILRYRVFFLTGPPDFQYQNEKQVAANQY